MIQMTDARRQVEAEEVREEIREGVMAVTQSLWLMDRSLAQAVRCLMEGDEPGYVEWHRRATALRATASEAAHHVDTLAA